MHAPPSRRWLSLAAVALAAAGASCGGCVEPSGPVTLRAVNRLGWPIFVRDELDQRGLSLWRWDGDGWVAMKEFTECSCEECSLACGLCDCEALPQMALRIEPGASIERVWSGEFREDDTTECWGASIPCVGGRVPAEPGRYLLELCWATALPEASSQATRFAAQFPSPLTCSRAEFELPATGAVQVATTEPEGCRRAAECAIGELCLDGQCTAGCPPNQVPPLGPDWSVEVGAPDNAGFFEVTDRPDGARLYQGAGTVGAVQYASGTTNLTLRRMQGSLDLPGGLYYTLPGGRALPLAVGDSVEVQVLEYPATASRRLARAVVIRRSGKLALLADTGRGGRVLDDLLSAPFAISVDAEPFACSPGDCGRRRFHAMSFTAAGGAMTLRPGERGELAAEGQAYEAVAVGSYSDEVTGCGPSPVVPHMIMIAPEVRP